MSPHQPHLISEPESEYELTPKEQAEKEAYLERLRGYLQDPQFRQIPGFPHGEDEDILALSDPPYYTACPNPFLAEIIEQWQHERLEMRQELDLPEDEVYHREPFASDVSGGKHNPIYYAHSYHTKVPHSAIMRYILHYTDPGDIVFDGFCGTGMTGVAAQLCADPKQVQELGYQIDDGLIYNEDEPISRLGVRKVVLVELSPAATFIAYNYNTPVNISAFEQESRHILQDVEDELGWMYETWHPHCDDPNRVKGKIHYVIWSDVFVCPRCGNEIVYWEEAINPDTGKIDEPFACPYCGMEHNKRSLDRSWETVYDKALGTTLRQVKQVPVLINYSVGRNRYDKVPDQEDLALIQSSNEKTIPYSFPDTRLPEGEKTSDPMNLGITHVHHFYTNRNLAVMAALLTKSREYEATQTLFALSSINLHINKMRRYQASKPGGTPNLPGTLYISSFPVELSPFDSLSRKLGYIKRGFEARSFDFDAVVSTDSSTDLKSIPSRTIDYIFIDPPFGSNLMYSELNFLWEAWIGVATNNTKEAIVNKIQRKGLSDYQSLMEKCFCEFFRILKPGRWITIEFHNSQNSVWNAIQQSLMSAYFIVADVRILDKDHSTFNQAAGGGAVKQDLVISAYKPRTGFEQRFLEQSGTVEGAWEFVRQHLAQLPIVVQTNGHLETLSERQDYLLFDRMVAFHIQRGATVPLSASQFYAGLEERFPARDGMYFLPEQVPEYDRARLQAESVAQLSLFVNDEKTAIQWLRQQLDPKLGGEPQTYQDLQPKFLRQLHQAKHEALPELGLLLDQNFLQDEQDRWYVPNPHEVSDLEKLRRKTLLREFKTYLEGKKKLKQFRTEAVRAGFADAYDRKDFETILNVAQRLPKDVLQEDPDLLMYYDAASLRAD